MDLKTFLENFDAIAEAPGGIPKLRSLILDLAVRGKLVPQNPEDEPAESVLTKQHELPTSYERRKKRVKPSDLKLSESLFSEIPASWAYLTIQELYDANILIDFADGNHGELYPRKTDFGDSGITFVTAAQIINGRVVWEKCSKLIKEKADQLNKGWAKAGDVLLTHNATVGRVALVESDVDDFLLGTSVTFYRLNHSVISPNYLFYVFCSILWQKQLEAVMEQTTRNQVSIQKQAFFKIPLPPLAEQKRIVEKVDELMGLCDRYEAAQQTRDNLRQKLRGSAIASLMNAETDEELEAAWALVRDNWHNLSQYPEDLEDLKQTTLQLAVRGKLVPQNPEDEPASILLQKVQLNKKHLLERGELHQKKLLKPIEKDEIPHDLPEGWSWCRFGQIIDCYRGHNPPKLEFIKEPREGYVRFIQITDFKTDDAVVYVPITHNLKYVYKGEIAMAAYRHIGKLSRSVEGAFNVAICKVIEIQPIYRDYIEKLIGSIYVKGELLAASGRAHIPSMHTEHLLSLVIPLPPLAEQKRIVAKVDELMKLCDQLEASLRQSQQRAESLAASAISHLTI